MEELQEKVKALTIGLQELLECPVCFNKMDSGLKQCINGHGVCNSCASKIDNCPICKQKLIIHQNTLLSQVLERLPKLCPYVDEGCTTVLFDQNHETFCEYRPTECKNTDCNWNGCVKDLLEHVRKCKKGEKTSEVSLNIEVSRSYIFSKNQSKDFFTPIILQNEIFWKYFKRNGLTKCISHQLYHVPTSKKTGNYYMVISFKKGNIEFKHTCKALSDLRNGIEEKDDNGILIPDSELVHFVEPGTINKYSYTLKLFKESIS